MFENAGVINESNLDREFVTQVASFPGGERIYSCLQCGTCSGSCQMSYAMDYTPRRLIEMTRVGMKKEVLSSKAIWYCAACYLCTVRCPRQVKLTEIMFALKSLALREKLYAGKEDSPVLYTVFLDVLKRFGRSHEGLLMTSFAMKTNPFRLLPLAPMGLRMLAKGKLRIIPARIRNVEEIRRLIQAAEEVRP
ncbi:MAG: 4Fe-4S dicluster domain-containing protein [Bacillota bacterium]